MKLKKATHFLQFQAISLCIRAFQCTRFSNISFLYKNEVIPPCSLIFQDFHKFTTHTRHILTCESQKKHNNTIGMKPQLPYDPNLKN